MNRSTIKRLLETTEPFLAKVRDIRTAGRTDEDAMLIRQLASKLILVSALVRSRLISTTELEGVDLFAAAHALFVEGYYIGPSNSDDLNIDGTFMVCEHIDGAPEHEHRGYFATGDNLADLIIGAFEYMTNANECSAQAQEYDEQRQLENAIRDKLTADAARGITPHSAHVNSEEEFVKALHDYRDTAWDPIRSRLKLTQVRPERYPAIVEFLIVSTMADVYLECVSMEYPAATIVSPITSKEYRVYHSVEFATALKAFQVELGVPARHQVAVCDPMPSSYPVSVRFTRTVTDAGSRIQLTMLDYTPDGENKPQQVADAAQPVGVIQKARARKIITGRNPHTYTVNTQEEYSSALIQYYRRVGLNPPLAGRVVNFPPTEFPARIRFSIADTPSSNIVQCEVLEQGIRARRAPIEHHDTCRAVRNGVLPCDCGMDKGDTP